MEPEPHGAAIFGLEPEQLKFRRSLRRDLGLVEP